MREQIALEYAIIKLALEYIGNNADTIQNRLLAFNKLNNFCTEKCALLPFFITTGNGHKKELLEYFNNDFITEEIGFVNSATKDIIVNTPKNCIINFKRYSVEIDVEAINKIASTVSLREYFIDRLNILTPNNQEENDFYNITHNHYILNLIEKSIYFIHEYKAPEFSKFDINRLKILSKSNFVYRRYKELFNKYKGYPQSITLIKDALIKSILEFEFDFDPIPSQVITVDNLYATGAIH
jgi:hypothetical protein